MKKVYISPCSEIIEFQLSQMITTSLPKKDDSTTIQWSKQNVILDDMEENSQEDMSNEINY
ncbi:MAG TPA: hypothetical protein DIS88_07200 [Prevotella sp.]|nr:hypothetical protein [Prevotella sp.]